MSSFAIRVHELSKRYRLGAQREMGVNSLRDTIANTAAKSLRAVRSIVRPSDIKGDPVEKPEVWALRDVSFEIKRGEVVGIIGPNGAGKSTLLKILSRITEPTSGYGEIEGRLGSLLEVGVQFHGELSGRENLHLAGAMLGMKKAEVYRKFQSIVDFAEVGRFIDTPTKYYSTGMGMRLAFAVAAHLEPEVLLVDEVLAVGDLAFQRKCLRKMEDIAAHGRTVLFVSHNLAAMQELCQSAIVLIGGKIAYRGPIHDAIGMYSHTMLTPEKDDATLGAETRWRHVCINGHRRGVVATSPGGVPFRAEATFELVGERSEGRFLCSLENARGETVLDQAAESEELGTKVLEPGIHQLQLEFPGVWLAPGLYTLYFKFTGSGVGQILWSQPAMLNITGALGSGGGGILAPPLRWRLTSNSRAERELVS